MSSKNDNPPPPDPVPKQPAPAPTEEEEEEEEVKLSPEEEASALEESQSIKQEANNLFTSNDFHNAISRYEDALLPLPKSAYFPRAVLHSNVAACHLKLEQWKDAVKSATTSLKALESLVSSPKEKDTTTSKEGGKEYEEEEEVVEEIISPGATKAHKPQQPQSDIQRIRIKALLRRARAHSQTDTWSSLAAAESDYRELEKLLTPQGQGGGGGALTEQDARTVRAQLRVLPPKVKQAQERETQEMWGKLKDLGNGILKPFGLSTDNFQMVQDEKTGGYSMNFNQSGS